ncbi:structural maintenance of chromosome protein [Cavenderia fasciculata]|uniref:Structural maintenance of chromosomes protein 5 n=1 Tax=Cavenderia fasciculata TaxID=261658 RepID=F4Q3V2_CACFS|nr:structural maintenance of chromosome protein [Cavenderia fasciculata]EGG17708.1 structural maintenance of chromosome protein [Cavenderia fasciculata]|eukprot:XP_004356192.1 structural maintenance of chromosome protein [Cavenderia fasciculata]
MSERGRKRVIEEDEDEEEVKATQTQQPQHQHNITQPSQQLHLQSQSTQQSASQKASIKDYVEGSIVRVKLINFVTYSEIEFTPGPRLNVIIGPNGSGKSSIVCALALGLGGGTHLLGRAKQAKDFIKNGEKHAIIEIELFVKGGTNAIVRRDIYDDNSTTFRLNGKKLSATELQREVMKFQIQIDNLCQFLPQDKVVSFAQMSKTELLVETEKAIGLFDMYENHMKLIEFKKELQNLNNTFQGQQNILDDLIKMNASIEKEVVRFQERNRLLKNVDDLNKKKAWLEFEAKRKIVDDLRIKKQQVEADMKRLDTEKAPLEQMAKSLLDSINNIGHNLEKKIATARQEETKVKPINAKIEKMSENIERSNTDLDNLQKRAEERKAEIQRSTNELQRIEASLQQLASEEEVKEKMQLKNVEIKELNEKLGSIQFEKNTCRQKRDSLQREKSDTEQEIAKLNNVTQRKLEALKRISPQCYKTYEYIQRNSNQFQHKVFGPVCVELSAHSDHYAKFLENTIPGFMLLAFICQSSQDKDTLYNYTRSNNLSGITSIYLTKAPDFRRDFRIEDLKEYGFECFLDQTFDCPTQVRDALIENTPSMVNYPCGTNKTMQFEEVIFQNTHLNLYFTPEKKYARTKSRYDSTVNNINISALKGSKVLSSSDVGIDDKIRGLQAKVAQIDEQLSKIIQTYQSLDAKDKEINNDIKKLQEERTQIGKAIDERKKLYSRMTNTSRQIEELKREENTEEEKAKINRQIKELHTAKVKCLNEVNAIIFNIARHSVDIDSFTLEKSKLESRRQTEFRKLEELTNSLRELKRTLDAVTADHTEATRIARQKKEEAEKLASLRDEETQILLENLPNDIDEIEGLIHETYSKIELIGQTNSTVIQEYEKRKADIEMHRNRIGNQKDKLSYITTNMEKTKREWLEPVNEFITEINLRFTKYFENIGCQGEIILAFDEKDPEDFERYAIEIRVKFREEEQLKALNAHQQSGGERSVSTMLFLISLQDLTSCPFRVVDEINQGMDPKNERMIFDQIVKTANRPGLPQYFLITPKLLHDLEYSQHTTVLCVFTGPWHMTQRDWESSFSNTIKSRELSN